MTRPAPRIALVTGASAGIGLATAVALARRGLALRLVGRDAAKLEAARAAVAAEGADVATFRADLSSLADVRALAAAVLARDEPLHVLVNNAGVWHPTFRRSKDGFEDTFAVNHLAHFLLTHLLLPRMRQSPGDRRIVHVSSRLHVQAGATGSIRGRIVHAANVLGLRVVARRALRLRRARSRGRLRGDRGLRAQQARAGDLLGRARAPRARGHFERGAPGLGRDRSDAREPPPLRAPAALEARAQDPAQGAETSVHVATSPALQGVSGRYFARSREAPAAPIADDPAIGARLWALSAERVGLPV